ncbi:hypothetical protein Poli38472_004060 [Pythium oligandrum]|uniref:Ketoreductase domain-containing protein n=1 Tax=Pythium oligandrum TaxID=41045 RepID=A0A8K1CMZ2_PYTOL|nr:hypothetical protein Poli38472_004060 [Pythium oligandrum]|eukprot:TMW66295.1 hypothetical protein Poli38472_004060 [Pythium oligandrum]
MSKTVLITGASRGIGLTFTKHYVQAGWQVIAAARNPLAASELQALTPYKIVQVDVADEETILNAAKELEGEAIDLLINNAGMLERETLDNTNKSDVMRQFEVNAVGSFLVTRAFVTHLKAAAAKNGLAKVANLSSRLGSITLNDNGGLYGYHASKAALNMINKSLAVDLKPSNIATVVYHPGYVATDMNKFQGVVQQADSVRGLTTHIEGTTLEHTGKFYDFEGNDLPW